MFGGQHGGITDTLRQVHADDLLWDAPCRFDLLNQRMTVFLEKAIGSTAHRKRDATC